MLCNEYFELLKQDYGIARKLSDKNDSLILLLKHKSLNKYLVLRKYSSAVTVYDYLKTVSAENLPAVYDSYHFDDGQVVLEEYVDGLTVSQVLENGLYTYNGAKAVIVGICNALLLLHSKGFVHRDIKPENIVVSNNGCVKLIDFNASRSVSLNAQKDTVAIGTIGYASPEQFGIAQSDSGTDIYALGVLLNVMLTGEHPSKKLAEGKAGKIILKCTQINPRSRYCSVYELMSEL